MTMQHNQSRPSFPLRSVAKQDQEMRAYTPRCSVRCRVPGCYLAHDKTAAGNPQMAIYHFSAIEDQVIGRSTGRSAVAAAAYRSASELLDEQLDRTHDYTAKAGVVHSEIMLPDGAPERWLDRQVLWNEVEARERQHNSQLARDVEISLPRELSKCGGGGTGA